MKPLRQMLPAEMKCITRLALEFSSQGISNCCNADLKLTLALQHINTHQSSVKKATGWQAVTLAQVTTAVCAFFVCLLVFIYLVSKGRACCLVSITNTSFKDCNYYLDLSEINNHLFHSIGKATH